MLEVQAVVRKRATFITDKGGAAKGPSETRTTETDRVSPFQHQKVSNLPYRAGLLNGIEDHVSIEDQSRLAITNTVEKEH